MKKILAFVMIVGLAVSAMGQITDDYGWWISTPDGDVGLTIGGQSFDFTQWGGSGAASELGTLTDLTITGLSVHLWANDGGQTGGNMFFALYDSEGTQLLANSWAGPDGFHWNDPAYDAYQSISGSDGAVNFTGSIDLLAANGATLVDGERYTLALWAKTYGGDGEKWYSNQEGAGGANYEGMFTYNSGTVIPEPATMSLLGLGALAMVLRRKLRK